MKAIVCTAYGSADVLTIREVDQPLPGNNDLLIRVHAAAVTTADSMMRSGKPLFTRLFLGFRKPRNSIPGTGFAGVVEAVGKDVTRFKKGDRLFGETGMSFSSNAEYVCVAEDGLLLAMPDSLSFEQAAPICDGALTSMNFLKALGNIQPDQQVLINAASGSLGLSAVQLARHFGAEVTAVCSGRNHELVTSVGANRVIDYQQCDFTTLGDRYDLIYDTIGNLSYTECKPALKASAVYLCPVLGLRLLIDMLLTGFTQQKAVFAATGIRPVPELIGLLEEVRDLYVSGVLTTHIDQHYSLDQGIDAHRHVETGHKRGNVVISMVASDPA